MTQIPEVTRLLADGRSGLPGALDAELRAQLFGALRDFCDRTNVWIEEISVSIVPNTLAYVLTPMANGRIIRLINLYNSTDLDKRPVAQATMSVPGALVLQQAPSAAATWVAVVSKVVVDPPDVDGNPVIAAWIFQKYYDALFDGMLSRMMAQPAKPYTDQKMAAYRAQKFTQAISMTRVEVLHANLYNAQRWAYPQAFATTRRQAGV